MGWKDGSWVRTSCTKTRTWVQIPNSLVRSQAWLHICLQPWCCQGKETGGWLARADYHHRFSERPFLNRIRQRVIEHLMFSSGPTVQDPVHILMPIYHTTYMLIHTHTREMHSQKEQLLGCCDQTSLFTNLWGSSVNFQRTKFTSLPLPDHNQDE